MADRIQWFIYTLSYVVVMLQTQYFVDFTFLLWDRYFDIKYSSHGKEEINAFTLPFI